MQHKKGYIGIITSVVCAAVVVATSVWPLHGQVTDAQTAATPTQSTSTSVSLPADGIATVGLPTLPKKRNSQIIEHVGYTVSFNNNWLIPNYVAYELTAKELEGTVKRSDDFQPDPKARKTVTTEDYKGSGYDRGHMAPAADMKWSKQAMIESFYLSNVCPQNQNLNRGDWNDLEELVRYWARSYERLYVVCGPIVGTTNNTIGTKHKVRVPDAFYKVIVCKRGQEWQGIGFIFKNEAGSRALTYYAVSIDEVERQTNLDFNTALPDSIENKIEKSYDVSRWKKLKK